MRHTLVIITCIAAVSPVAAQNPRTTTITSPRGNTFVVSDIATMTVQAHALAAQARTIAHSGLTIARAQHGLTTVRSDLAGRFVSPAFIASFPVTTRSLMPSRIESPSTLPRASWAPQDPADSLWRRAREALNNDDPARAAGMYQQIRTNARYARSAYRAPSYYWEAFARQRVGTTTELRLARRVLEQLKRDHPRYEAMADATRLEATINGQLAQMGDAQAASATTTTATRATTQQCDETQMAALEALMHMPHENAIPILKRVMQRRDCDKMRETAVFLIAQSRSPEAEDILLEAVRNDPNQKVKEAAVFFLSQVNSEKSLDALESIIRSGGDPKLTETAVFALSQHRSPRATELLRQMVTRTDISADARANAIFHLGQRSDANVTTLLRTLYGQTTDRKTKEAILFALSQRRDAAIGDFLFQIAMNEREDIEIRKNALFFASQQRQLPVSRLAELYRSIETQAMREQILFALSQSRDPEAVPQLIEIYRIERNTELRKNIIFWLGQSKDPRAVRFIGELIGG